MRSEDKEFTMHYRKKGAELGGNEMCILWSQAMEVKLEAMV